MKILSSKVRFSGFLLAGSLFGSLTASASLLVGFHDFDGTANSEVADFVAAGYAGTISKSSVSTNAFGSATGLYGGDSGHQPSPGVNDGMLNANFGGATILTMTNVSGLSPELKFLFFDAANTSGAGPAGINVSYETASSGGYQSLGNSGSLPATFAGYNAFSFDLKPFSISLLVGEWISFKFEGLSDKANIDNIAIVAVPEPGSLLALGCLVGSGVFLRSRSRRKVVA